MDAASMAVCFSDWCNRILDVVPHLSFTVVGSLCVPALTKRAQKEYR
jgi:hypothetical protein